MAPAMRGAGHDLAVVGARSLTRAQAFASRHGVRRARGSYDEVLAARDVDAIYVALHPAAHEEWAIAALDAGKHVLCERPLAVDGAAAARIAAAAVAAGCVAMEAHMTRFHPRTQALLELVDSGEIGQVRYVQALVSARMRDLDNYRADPGAGGGALLDAGGHGVAMSRWLVGEEPEAVHALSRRWRTGVDGMTTALLSFPSGAIASVAASFEGATHEVLEITGTSGALRAVHPFTAGPADEVSLERDGTTIGTWQADPFQRMLTAFAHAVRDGTEPPLPIEDSVATASVLDAIAAVSG